MGETNHRDIYVYNITWQEPNVTTSELPAAVYLTDYGETGSYEIEEDIPNYLSDKYGCEVEGYQYTVLDEEW